MAVRRGIDWWKQCIVYQVYPRSFQDSNGDGIGDLRGITDRLGYLEELGIDLIWLGPVCKSPNRDMGYDVSNYTAIMDEYGTLADFDELITKARARGIGLMIDLVFNHSSSNHPWFREARKSKSSTKRDYYIWRNSGDTPPNNWQSLFGGPAWSRDEETGDYYLHLFSADQPDLNWENPELRQALYSIMRFWIARGVAGFRFDVISFISKPADMSPAPPGDDVDWLKWYANGPRLHEYLRELQQEVLAGTDVVTVGEAPGITASDARDFVDPRNGELDMLFLFDLMGLDRHPAFFHRRTRWHADDLRRLLRERDAAIGDSGWNSNYLGNHDFPRMVSRFGDDGEYREASAKMLATLVLTLRGTPFIYNGDEIGMTDVRFESIDEYRDILTVKTFERLVSDGTAHDPALDSAAAISRDNARTPMQWTNNRNAGFTDGDSPWIGINPNYKSVNVDAARADPGSIYHFYRRLIRLRREHTALTDGDFSLHEAGNDDVIAYSRARGGSRIVVLLNFAGSIVECGLAQCSLTSSLVPLACNYERTDLSLEVLRLRPFEAIIAAVPNEAMIGRAPDASGVATVL